jgi:isoquinoline 1-oxidoreductase beta subunit
VMPDGVSRRLFLKTGVAGGAALVIGVPASRAATPDPATKRTNPFDAWIRIGADGRVTLLVPKAEMGQGVRTSLAMILAEELEVDWKSVQVEQAPTNLAVYDHGTYGSASVHASYLPLRQAGAAARDMLKQAGASRWRVNPTECIARAGSVVNVADGRRLGYGELVGEAAQLAIPDLRTVPLKPEIQFGIIGTNVPGIGVAAKVDGSAQFGLDVRLPGMLYAVVARCPAFSGKLRRFDALKAKAVPGVKEVLELPASGPRAFTVSGVAVVADDTWSAICGRAALEVEWDLGDHVSESSIALRQQFQQLLSEPGIIVRNQGDIDLSLTKAFKSVEAVYELPFQAHAPMEPMNSTVRVESHQAEAWVPCQDPEAPRDEIARITGLKPEQVVVHTTLMGGGFGRRDHSDFAVEAAQVSKAVAAPVQVVWTREDDIQHDFYRSAAMHRLTAALDERGRPVGWRHRLSSASINGFWSPQGRARPEQSEIGGAADLPYAIPNLRVEYAPAMCRIPVTWWRSVAHSINVFATECFVDELAASAKVDPLEFRLQLLGDGPAGSETGEGADAPIDKRRLKAVLETAAARAKWGHPLPSGTGRGIAAVIRHGTYVAEVAEVTIENGQLRVKRVVCAVDCGRAIHPDGVQAQIEGGVVYGLTAAIKGEITIEQGSCKQTNFHDYDMLRIDEMPAIDVHVLPSREPPSGAGEQGVPPIAPAVANAIFAITGRRVRRLPIVASDLG